ncbi:MAG: sigma-70 family RNA polymerase sigma factor [Spirochaetes bacterium]|nr:MAG: sigma-70 family RNA polymerase sigma factor [Spirochaetota bacterium]
MTENEFARIVTDTKRVVLSAVERHLPPRFHHAIDDVVQETYLRAYTRLVRGAFRGDAQIGTWLYEIAKNESLRMGGRLAREEEKSRRAGIALAGRVTEMERAEEKIALEEFAAQIRALPEKYRTVMELAAAGCGEREISERLGIRAGTVKSRMSRGRELLARMGMGGGS